MNICEVGFDEWVCRAPPIIIIIIIIIISAEQRFRRVRGDYEALPSVV